MKEYRKLKAKMYEYGITQEKLAKMIGISHSSLNEKLNGKRDWKLSECKKIMEILDISFDFFWQENLPKSIKNEKPA